MYELYYSKEKFFFEEFFRLGWANLAEIDAV